jgi:hypothetical protein
MTVGLNVGLGRIACSLFSVPAMAVRLYVRIRRLLGVVVLALIGRVTMAMSFDVVLGRVVVTRVTMVLAVVLVVRHSGSSCLWANTKN